MVLFVNPLTPRVKPAVEQYVTVVLFVLQFYPIYNFGKFITFRLGTVSSEGLSSVLLGALWLNFRTGAPYFIMHLVQFV